MKSPQSSGRIELNSGPWWRHPMMWLVVGGPLAVVVAAILTAVIAIRGADIVVDANGMERGTTGLTHAPAVQGRNHAATPNRP